MSQISDDSAQVIGFWDELSIKGRDLQPFWMSIDKMISQIDELASYQGIQIILFYCNSPMSNSSEHRKYRTYELQYLTLPTQAYVYVHVYSVPPKTR